MALDRLRRAWVSLGPPHVALLSLPDGLPPCVRCCGLIPSPLPAGFRQQRIRLLQTYFVAVLGAWGRERNG